MLGEANEENDAFMHAMEGLDHAIPKKITVFEHHHPEFFAAKGLISFGISQYYNDLFEWHREASEIDDPPPYFEITQTAPASPSCLLFQHRGLNKDHTFGIMGICSGKACERDLVCQLRHLNQAVIVRKLKYYENSLDEYYLVGMAALSIDILERRNEKAISSAYNFKELELVVDPKGLYSLVT